MPQAGFEPAIPATKRPDTYALDLAVTGIDIYRCIYIYIYNIIGGPGFDSRAVLRIFLRELGLERGPLSLVIG
jgi:hypothetical protein